MATPLSDCFWFSPELPGRHTKSSLNNVVEACGALRVTAGQPSPSLTRAQAHREGDQP